MNRARVAATEPLIVTMLVVATLIVSARDAGARDASSRDASSQWYLSNEFGVVREEIDEEKVDELEYVVRVERSAALEVQTLYHESKPVERTELEYAEGRLRSRRSYRDGELVATDYFRYWADGTLRLVRRIAERGGTIEYRYRDGRLDEEWLIRSTETEQTVYDAVGRIAERVRREDGELVERETREYWGDSPEDALRRVVVFAGGTETVSRYDESGRLLGSSVARDGEVAADRTRVYEDGLLVEEREQTEGVVKVWRYEYEDDQLVTERYLEDGELVKRTEYRVDGYTRLETLYRGGEEALRVYYRDRERAVEEVVRAGEVVRTRSFAATGGDDEAAEPGDADDAEPEDAGPEDAAGGADTEDGL
jgi:antitoxin component YwqK of YwqJK toxin-antitoxin module